MARRYRYHKDRYRYDTYDYEDNNDPGCLQAILFGILFFLFSPIIVGVLDFLSDLIFNPIAIIDSVPKNLRELPERTAILPNRMPRIASFEIEAEKNLCHVIVSKEAKPLLVKENQNSILLPEQEEPPDKLLTYDPKFLNDNRIRTSQEVLFYFSNFWFCGNMLLCLIYLGVMKKREEKVKPKKTALFLVI